MLSSERRKYPRMGCDIPADLLNMGDDPSISRHEPLVRGQVLDVSLQGLRLKINYNVTLDSMLSVIVYYRGSESVCLCRVIWKRDLMKEAVYGLFIKEWSKLDPLLKKKLEMTPKTITPTSTPQPEKAATL